MIFDNHGLILCDVSHWQDDNKTPNKIDFRKMKAAGAVGVIIKAGQNSWRDEDFIFNWKAAKEAGLPRGSYFFYDSRAEPGNQATVWRGLIDGDYPELGLWADLEEDFGGVWKGEIHWQAFLEAARIMFRGQMIGIYTADWWWSNQVVLHPSYFADFPLWVAQYTSNPADVVLPYPWRSRNKQAVLWQFTEKGDGPKYGTESLNVDLSYFNGDAQSFKDYFKLSGDVLPPEPPQGGAMLYGTVIATATLNIRSGPGLNYLDIGDLHNGDKLVASENIGGWWKLVSINGVPVAVTETYAMSNAGLWIRQDSAPPAADTVDFVLTVQGFKTYAGKLEKA